MSTGQPVHPAQGFATRQLHAGDSGANAHHSRTTPIYLTAGFSFDDFDEARDRFAGAEGFTYTRIGNPTNSALEKRVAALEGGVEAILVGSGQAALTVALLGLLQAGDELVSASSIYEGSRGLFNDNFSRFGIATSYIDDANDADAWRAAITPRTRALFIESIPNPRNDVVDIALIAEIAHEVGIPLVVDNTFATPYLLRPFEHGADIVVHSASKFLAGHGSVIAGIVVDGGRFDWAANAERFPHLAAPATGLNGSSHIEVFGRGAYGAFARNTVASRLGPTPSPLNAFLIQQGVETLSLRVERQSANALAIAEWLDAQDEIESVDYSGLPNNPYYSLAQRYLPDGQGSVFSFTVAGGLEAARAFTNAVGVFTRMSHLGDVRSLILHPASTSHTARTPEELVIAGIGQGLLRVSIGIEDVHDLIADLEVGLAAARLAVSSAQPLTHTPAPTAAPPLALLLEG